MVGVGVLPRIAWKLAPRVATAMSRKRFPAPVVADSFEGDVDRKLYREAVDLVRSGRKDALLQRIKHELADRESTPMGVRHSELTVSALYSDLFANQKDPAAAAAAAQPFRNWYVQSGHDPDAAALTARALQILALAQLGDDPASADRVRLTAMSELLAEAHDLLHRASPSAENRELVYRTLFRGALLDCDDPEERHERFERFLAFDPANAVTYFERASQLLPRWQGSYSYGAIEDFTRQSTERTGHFWGTALYTMIYTGLSGDIALDKAHADWMLILDGFEDQLEFLPQIPVINDFIRVAARFGRDEITRKLFAVLPELRLDRWDDADEPFEVYAWAHGHAPWPYAPGNRRAPPVEGAR